MSISAVTTTKAREKFAKAHGGTTPLPAIMHVGWGTGGHNEETRLPITPTADVNEIPGEVTRKEIKGIEYPIPTTLRIFVDLLYEESGDEDISCCGLYDADGDLVAWKTFKPKGMDDETTLEIDWDEQF